MTKREAERIDRTDATPYVVEMPGQHGYRLRYHVTGYRSAKVVAGRNPLATITPERTAR